MSANPNEVKGRIYAKQTKKKENFQGFVDFSLNWRFLEDIHRRAAEKNYDGRGLADADMDHTNVPLKN